MIARARLLYHPVRNEYCNRTLPPGVTMALRSSPAHVSFHGLGLYGSIHHCALLAASWRRAAGGSPLKQTPVDGSRRAASLSGCCQTPTPHSAFGAGLVATRGPHSKHPRAMDRSVAASFGFLVPIVHDLALTRALVQVAEFSHPDEREAVAATRTPYFRREWVKPHWTLWRHFIPAR